MHLKSASLQYVRHMECATLPFETRAEAGAAGSGHPRRWTVLLGRNGSCKSTLLQCLALGALASEAEILKALGGLPELRTVGGHGPTVIDVEFGGREGHRRMTLERPASGAVPTVTISGNDTPLVLGFGVSRLFPRYQGGEGGGVDRTPNPRFHAAPTPADRLSSILENRRELHGFGFMEILPPDRRGAFVIAVATTLLRALEASRHGFPAVSLGSKGELRLDELQDALEQRELPVKEHQRELTLKLAAVSHGYQATLGWIAELIGHAILADAIKLKDVKGSTEALEAVVLLDEIDQHLHPAWQSTIVPALKAALPRVQFVVTTHSPLVVASCEPGEVFDLAWDGPSITIKERPGHPREAGYAEILAGDFGVCGSGDMDLRPEEREYLRLLGKDAARRTKTETARLKTLERSLGNLPSGAPPRAQGPKRPQTRDAQLRKKNPRR